jgi:hypothetical protein
MTRRLLLLAAALAALAVHAPGSHAQQVSQVHRRLLMIGVHGTHVLLDAGEGRDREGLTGWGGKLLINLAPFSGPGNTLMDNLVLGFFVQGASGDDVSVLHSGAEVDLHFVYNPIEGLVDPFVTLGAGRFRVRVDDAGDELSEANLALSPGVGVRVPLRGLLELRADARDVIVFDSEIQDGTAHNLEFTAGLNLRF